jgi:hypothetical protein
MSIILKKPLNFPHLFIYQIYYYFKTTLPIFNWCLHIYSCLFVVLSFLIIYFLLSHFLESFSHFSLLFYLLKRVTSFTIIINFKLKFIL